MQSLLAAKNLYIPIDSNQHRALDFTVTIISLHYTYSGPKSMQTDTLRFEFVFFVFGNY